MKSISEKELELLNILWDLKKAFLKEILEAYMDKKPAYTTVSTMLQRLVDKGHIGFTMFGRDKQYHPILQKRNYFKNSFSNMISKYFNSSPSQFASFFTKDTNLSVDQLKDLRDLINKEIDKKEQS